ncbi:hypothetical protein HanIR_Chr04g0150631 [Helianthus annuus]|nr:hypothetical protein HanIR_Chr04g0150631 [Helianthus annuus]
MPLKYLEPVPPIDQLKTNSKPESRKSCTHLRIGCTLFSQGGPQRTKLECKLSTLHLVITLVQFL